MLPITESDVREPQGLLGRNRSASQRGRRSVVTQVRFSAIIATRVVTDTESEIVY